MAAPTNTQDLDEMSCSKETDSKQTLQPDMTTSKKKDEQALVDKNLAESSSKKHKRKISYDENETPTKIIKADINIDINSQNLQTDSMKFYKLANNYGIHAGKKHFPQNLDSSLQPPLKKRKSEGDILRQDGLKKKHYRKRMKHILKAVVDQMEFYFGDSNLSKDRYLRNIIDSSPDGYVDLCVFGNFNKLQSLHKDGVSLNVLSAAIKKSKMLKLNDDENKVKRTTAIKEISQKEIDSRTVYVEHLPSHANHMWIKKVFCQCGKVVYVSLPVYKTTKIIKGFAFVEFETSEEAAKACLMLNNPLPVKSEEKPGKFPKGNKTLNRLQKLAPVKIEEEKNEDETPSKETTDAKQTITGATNKKKKKKNPKKKRNHDSTSDDNSTKLNLASGDHGDNKVEQGEKKKKKKKKRKKQGHCQDEKSDTDNQSNMECDEAVPVGDNSQKVSAISNESVTDDPSKTSLTTESEMLGHEDNMKTDDTKVVAHATVSEDDEAVRKKKSKKRRKSEKKKEKESNINLQAEKLESSASGFVAEQDNVQEMTESTDIKLSRKERKRLRQEDINRKKREREEMGLVNISNSALRDVEDANLNQMKDVTTNDEIKVTNSKEDIGSTDVLDNEAEKTNLRRSDGSELASILKSKRGQERKKVEFDPVAVTNEFVKGREIRKRKKPKKEKLHLRVITKDEWLSLKAEYIAQQKSHMAALKESLRELRLQENQGKPQVSGHKHIDLEDVFGTKRLKPSQDLKLAHVESLKFTPNVIVQWKCSHDMHRDKIRTMFKEMSGDSIAYIDAKEEAKFGYIRFKDEASAEEFAKLSRRSTSFMARILPGDQQEDYWKRANEDRIKKLGRKKHEKGAEKIARKVFERNKATFFQKPNHIVFNDDNDDIDKKILVGETKLEDYTLQDGD